MSGLGALRPEAASKFVLMKIENLATLRTARGLEPEAIALLINMEPEDVLRFEADPTSALEELDLHQWTQWAANLGLPLLELLATLKLCETGAVVPVTFREWRDAIGVLASELGGLEAAEDRIGWDLADFVRDPEDGWSRKLIFFHSLAKAVGRDWRGVAAAYGSPA